MNKGAVKKSLIEIGGSIVANLLFMGVGTLISTIIETHHQHKIAKNINASNNEETIKKDSDEINSDEIEEE